MRFPSILLLALLLGCGEDSSAPAANTGPPAAAGLAGSWEVVATEGEGAEPNLGLRYVFGEGTLTIGEGALASEGSFRQRGDTLFVDLYGVKLEALVAVEGAHLTWSIVHSDQVLTLERR